MRALLFVLPWLAACAPSDGSGAAPAPPSSVGQPAPGPAWTGPAFTVDVLRMESFPEQYAAVVSVDVPSGGHALRLDSTEAHGDRVVLFVTLERPAEGAMTTQALETLTVRHGTGTQPIGSVEVRARTHRRGEPAPPTYARATD